MADLTPKQEWQNKMWRYYLMSPTAKEMAIDRVTAIAFRDTCWDWDDNVPVEWARDLARQWELSDTHADEQPQKEMHVECVGAMHDEIRLGAGIEYFPYDNERPDRERGLPT